MRRIRLREFIKGKRGIIFLVIIGTLLLIRALLPVIIKYYVLRTINNIPEYEATIDDIDLNLFRGSYQIEAIKINKIAGDIPVPFFAAKQIDLSVQWSALFRGSVVGEINLKQPKVNFVDGPSAKQSQTGDTKGWQQAVQDLFPLQINQFSIWDGEIHFRNFHTDPEIDIFIDSLLADASNLTNVRDLKKSLISDVNASGLVLDDGRFELNLNIDPLKEKPEFSLDFKLQKVNLVKLNNFLRHYGKFDVENGSFELYGEFAAAEGNFEGYIKPIFEHLQIIDLSEDVEKPLKLFWEFLLGGTSEGFENQSKDRLATKIPFNGSLKDPEADTWSAIGNLLKNAFIRAILPDIDRTVELEDVK